MLFANDLLNYTSTLSKLGDELIESSSGLNVESPKTIEELKGIVQKQINALDKFRQIRQSLSFVSTPPYLKPEHNNLISAFDDYVVGTEQFIDSLRLYEHPTREHTADFYPQLYSEGQHKQKLAVQKTQAAVIELAKKIEASLKK